MTALAITRSLRATAIRATSAGFPRALSRWAKSRGGPATPGTVPPEGLDAVSDPHATCRRWADPDPGHLPSADPAFAFGFATPGDHGPAGSPGRLGNDRPDPLGRRKPPAA